jgi:hypothetical protein
VGGGVGAGGFGVGAVGAGPGDLSVQNPLYISDISAQEFPFLVKLVHHSSHVLLLGSITALSG